MATNSLLPLRLLWGAGLAAAIGFSAQASAQASSSGSAEIVGSGGVNLLQDSSAPPSGGMGEVTFVLSTQMNGALAVQLPGFVAQSSTSGNTLLLDSGGGKAVTGTTMASEALSLSFSAGAAIEGARSGRAQSSNVTLLLAQYN